MSKKKKKELIYLASPYTHSDKAVMQERFEKVLRMTAYLIRQGLFVFSPIAYGHTMAMKYKVPTEWGYWCDFDSTIISRCDKVMVLKIKGWDKSKGVQAEIQVAKDCGIPVVYISDKIKKKITN
jgi:hypothetical protein